MVLLKTGARGQGSGIRKAFSIIAFLLIAYCPNAFAEEKVYRIKIDGMHCKSCVYSVTKSLKKLKQVKDVEVRLKEGIAIVTLNDGKDVAVKELGEAVKDSGYKLDTVEIEPSK